MPPRSAALRLACFLAAATLPCAAGEGCQVPSGSREDQCTYIEDTEECDVAEFIDYLDIYYCADVSQVAANVLLAVFVVWWCLLIVVLGTTADEYFCPPLTSMARWLELRPRVAAVTLLALANGAPDIFAVQSALATGDTALAVGALIGGTLFVTCLVIPIVIFCSADRIRAGGMLFRDVTTFLITVGILAAIVGLSDEVQLWEPLVFLGLYVLYVASVTLSHKFPPMLAADRIMAFDIKEQLLKAPPGTIPPSLKTTAVLGGASSGSGELDVDIDAPFSASSNRGAAADLLDKYTISAGASGDQQQQQQQEEKEGPTTRRPSLTDNGAAGMRLPREFDADGGGDGGLLAQFLTLSDWQERSCFEKVLYALEIPFRLGRTSFSC